jgi:hypothetical protein
MCRRLIGSLLLLASSAVHAATLDISVDAFFPPPLDPPIFIDNNINVFPLFFALPFEIAGVNSATLRLELFDDGPRDTTEEFRVLLQTSGPGNLHLATFLDNLGVNLGANDPLSAYTFTHTFAPSELAALYNEIACGCGFFTIRLNRDRGDFYLGGATMEMNVSDVPEPATVSLTGSALLVAGLVRRSRRGAHS